MKFATLEDKKLFLIEIEKVSLIEKVDEAWEPTPDLLEMYVKKRNDLIPKYRDFRRSQSAKEAWRHNRYNFMKGIKRFHKSTKGKRMHRAIGDFLATRESYVQYSPFHPGIFEALKAINSLKTHAYIELEHFMPMEDYIEFTELVENIIPMIGRADDTLIKASIGLNKDDVELLYRLTEEKELILAYSRKLNKPVEDVQNSWNQIKEKLLQTKVEEYEYLYTELVEKLESKLNP
jgi:hypothetical protein